MPSADSETPSATHAIWLAVISMALCASALTASEFTPSALLTPIARDFGLAEGQTGQTFSISGALAVLTSLTIANLTRRIDRRRVLLFLAGLLAVSGTLVALAPNPVAFMLARALLGIGVGGFWSLQAATVIRLLPSDLVPRGFAIINVGPAIAIMLSAPISSMLGDYVGWRLSFFFVVVPLAIVALGSFWLFLPPLPPAQGTTVKPNLFRLLGRRQFALGLGALLLLFMGRYSLETYLRPYLEMVGGIKVPLLSFFLLLPGLAGLVGNYLVQRILRRQLFSVIITIPLVMALTATGLIVLGANPVMVAILLIVWGLFAAPSPVGWYTWLSRTAPDDAEAGGGLQIATIQFAIYSGGVFGGLLFDSVGWWSAFAFGTVVLCASAVLAIAAWRESANTPDL